MSLNPRYLQDTLELTLDLTSVAYGEGLPRELIMPLSYPWIAGRANRRGAPNASRPISRERCVLAATTSIALKERHWG